MKQVLWILVAGACATPTAPPPAHQPPPGAYSQQTQPRRLTDADWVVLGQAPVAGVSQTVEVSTTQPFSHLRVEAVEGAPEIEQLEIEYANNGGSRVVRLSKTLAEGEGQVIELRERKPIARIVVVTDPDAAGQFVIFGA